MKIFINGNVFTMDDALTKAEAFAVEEGRFVAVGSNEELLKLKTDSSEVIDLAGKMTIPGLNDSHLHLMSVGMALEQVNLSGTTSRADLIERCVAFMAANPDLEWLLGRGWNQAYYPDNTMPNRHDLDQVSTTKPILIRRACGHISSANTYALQLAGLIDGGFEQPDGGHIDVDEQGIPTGILRERAAGLVAHLIPKSSKEDYKRHIIKGAEQAVRFGLTTVQSDDLGSPPAMITKLEAFREVLDEGKLPIRVNHQVRLANPVEIEAYLEIRDAHRFPENTVYYGPLKLMTDGSLGGRTALMHAPYTDDFTTNGVSIMTQEAIIEMYRVGHQHGLQLSAHAIGDLAIQKLLNAFRIVLNENPCDDARPRIIHAQITTPHILEQMKELGVVCDIQPIFVPTDMNFVEDRLGNARAMQSYPWKTMLDMGIHIAGGSDSPVESCNPMWGIAAAVTRQDHNGNPEDGWRPDQKLSVLEAIQLFTRGSAYSERTEQFKGAIQKGMLADFVVLNEDLTAIAPETIKDVKVVCTYVNGNLVYHS